MLKPIQISAEVYSEAMTKIDSARALCETLATLQHGGPECPPSPDQLAGSLYGIAALLDAACKGLLHKAGT